MTQPSYAHLLAVADDFDAVVAGFRKALKRGLRVTGGEVLHSDVDDVTGDILATVSFDAGRVRAYRLTITEKAAQ